MKPCEQCKELQSRFVVTSRLEFSNLLNAVKDNLKEGIIEETDYWPPGQIKFDCPPFEEMKDHGPWATDIYAYYFRCTACGQLFLLQVDTYHGHGGWNTVVHS